MAETSPFQQFQNWLFDGSKKSEIPQNILKSTSPISSQYCISIFLNNPKLNHYLNTYFNNINIWYLEKEELFTFIKKCVNDFRIQRRSLAYIPWRKTDKLFNSLRKKFTNLKDYEIVLYMDFLQKDENKDQILTTLGLNDDKKLKLTKNKKSKNKKSKINKISEFIEENIRIEE
ncbi:MAG TPA: hypothetical protein PLA60_03280 [Candidatus Pacearchaeota archaeon]|jgi:hypothetical protein|nr:hypothetical protein [Candidatus Pacearchaeota archaeon]